MPDLTDHPTAGDGDRLVAHRADREFLDGEDGQIEDQIQSVRILVLHGDGRDVACVDRLDGAEFCRVRDREKEESAENCRDGGQLRAHGSSDGCVVDVCRPLARSHNSVSRTRPIAHARMRYENTPPAVPISSQTPGTHVTDVTAGTRNWIGAPDDSRTP